MMSEKEIPCPHCGQDLCIPARYNAENIAQLEEELVAWQLRDAEELESLRMRVLKAEAENRAWLELCRYFVGGGDEHIKELMRPYLDDLLTAKETDNG